MKKYTLFFALLCALIFSCAAAAADGDWASWKADLSDASSISCEIVPASLEYDDYKAIIKDCLIILIIIELK